MSPGRPQKRRAEQVGFLVADIVESAGAIRRLGDQIAGAVNQTQARWSALSVFSSDGDWTVARAARRLGITRQSLQRVVDLLLAEGLLVAEQNPHHARSPLIRLTADGERIFEMITEAVEPWERSVGSRMSLAELLTARKVVALITEAAHEWRPEPDQA